MDYSPDSKTTSRDDKKINITRLDADNNKSKSKDKDSTINAACKRLLKAVSHVCTKPTDVCESCRLSNDDCDDNEQGVRPRGDVSSKEIRVGNTLACRKRLLRACLGDILLT